MSQLKEDEWPSPGEVTTTERQQRPDSAEQQHGDGRAARPGASREQDAVNRGRAVDAAEPGAAPDPSKD
jgi:hypothetical protein